VTSRSAGLSLDFMDGSPLMVGGIPQGSPAR
jgi:hypothetical protein